MPTSHADTLISSFRPCDDLRTGTSSLLRESVVNGVPPVKPYRPQVTYSSQGTNISLIMLNDQFTARELLAAIPQFKLYHERTDFRGLYEIDSSVPIVLPYALDMDEEYAMVDAAIEAISAYRMSVVFGEARHYAVRGILPNALASLVEIELTRTQLRAMLYHAPKRVSSIPTLEMLDGVFRAVVEAGDGETMKGIARPLDYWIDN